MFTNPLQFGAPAAVPSFGGSTARPTNATMGAQQQPSLLGMSSPASTPSTFEPAQVMGGDTLAMFNMINTMMVGVFQLFTATIQWLSQLMASGGSSGGGTPGGDSSSGSTMPVSDGSKPPANKGGSPTSGGNNVTAPAPGQAGKGGNLEQWIDEAIAILKQNGVPESKINRADLKLIIMKESSGNPRAINNWDSNAAKGTPSKGLMQTIDSTFNAHKLPGYNDVYNPVHNIIAGVRYSISRYGSISAVAEKKKGGRNDGY